MSGLIKLHVGVVLKHVLDLEPVLYKDPSSDESSDEDDDRQTLIGHPFEIQEDSKSEFNETRSRSSLGIGLERFNFNRRKTIAAPNDGTGDENKSNSIRIVKQVNGIFDNQVNRKKKHSKKQKDPYGSDILDFNGPELMQGAKGLLFFLKLIGQTNWIGYPLWVSIIYKAIVYSVCVYVGLFRIIKRLLSLSIVDENYRNPIFLLISFLGISVCVAQFITTIFNNLVSLSPMYKILTTPKLCFIRTDVQYFIGAKLLALFVSFTVYQSTIIRMLTHRDLTEFINEFSLPMYLMEIFTMAVSLSTIVGISLVDLYIRSCFGHWLLALKSHLENRFMNFHKKQKKLKHQQQLAQLQLIKANQQHKESIVQTDFSSFKSLTTNSNDSLSYLSLPNEGKRFKIMSLDEIQRSLNNMDDHLEVLRSVQIGSLVNVSLIAFLMNGSLFLLTYHVIANRSNSYHGLALLLISVNSIIVIFMCYSGDRWIFYALESFVQTVEDEYFMQHEMKPGGSSPNISLHATATGASDGGTSSVSKDPTLLSTIPNVIESDSSQQIAQQLLLIRKNDVLFCREFLHQFENHLATPWSKLTVKTHLHMLRTFVTLIAAQIIFDHEH